ncbi:MAG TPA: hypothetical protein VKW08_19025 [Xanthobacteraceae bacterium]|nr:hypothetical protein [Xanthobacteraceae bacterium]
MNVSADASTSAVPDAATIAAANAINVSSALPEIRPASAPAHGLAPLPFGPAPLAEGEDAEAYDELLLRISAGVRPADILEEIWVRDVVDLTWEALRLRRLKAAVLTMSARTALAENLGKFMSYAEAQALARSWAAGEADAVAAVAERLAAQGLGIENLTAQGLTRTLDPIERIARMIAQAEARRGAALREVERHRASFGPRLRAALVEAEAAA